MMKFALTALAALLLAGCANSDRTQKNRSRNHEMKKQNEARTGAYTDGRAPSQEELTLFQHATDGLTGVVYTPESVSTQVVAGTNYRFVCTAQPAAQNKPAYRVEIVIYRPLPGQGEPRITLLKPL